MLKIKAALYNNGDVEQYFKGLLASDTRPVPDYESYCLSCREMRTMISINRDEEFTIQHSDHEPKDSIKVIVESVPKHKCSTCGKVSTNVKLSAAIEEALDVQVKIHSGIKTIPFCSLVS
ncbi:hypothetical protein [Paenibacillus taichungensis]